MDLTSEFEPSAGRDINRPGFVGGSGSQVDWSHDGQDDEQI